MPGTTPATSQLEWLSSTTAMIVIFWSRATRDLLRSFGWGIAALHRENPATKLPFLATRPIASIGPAEKETAVERGPAAIVVSRDDLCLMTPSSLSVRHLSSATAERPFTRAGP